MRKKRNALVIWYSQTGFTEKYGENISQQLKDNNFNVFASDYRNVNQNSFKKYDLIIIGSPVYYYDIPGNFKSWLKEITDIENTPVAVFSTFGNSGDNQHNTAVFLMDIVVKKGAIPIHLDTFGNISTWPMFWINGPSKRMMNYSHLPDKNTYNRLEDFTSIIIKKFQTNESFNYKKYKSVFNLLKGAPVINGTKLLIKDHNINTNTCTQCGSCEKKCPVNAVSIKSGIVNSKTCIACMGCINNCPNESMKMKFIGKDVYGFKEFQKRYL